MFIAGVEQFNNELFRTGFGIKTQGIVYIVYFYADVTRYGVFAFM